MNSIMNIPGLKDCQVIKMEERKGEIFLYVEMERKPHPCPDSGQLTNKVHDYRWQKVQHLKWFERMTYIWYKRRRYACACGKRFPKRIRLSNDINEHRLNGIRPCPYAL